MTNTDALLWHYGSNTILERELANAINRFGQRPELAGRVPKKLIFRTGETPQQLPFLNGLHVEENDLVPVGGNFILA